MPEDDSIRVRPAPDIVRAHDRLKAVLSGELRLELDEANRSAVIAIVSTLCWVLEHDHGDSVQKLVDSVEEFCRATGIAEIRLDDKDTAYGPV